LYDAPRSRKVCATALPREIHRHSEALERLVQLYDATGNAAEAERWRKELAVRKAAEKVSKK